MVARRNDVRWVRKIGTRAGDATAVVRGRTQDRKQRDSIGGEDVNGGTSRGLKRRGGDLMERIARWGGRRWRRTKTNSGQQAFTEEDPTKCFAPPSSPSRRLARALMTQTLGVPTLPPAASAARSQISQLAPTDSNRTGRKLTDPPRDPYPSHACFPRPQASRHHRVRLHRREEEEGRPLEEGEEGVGGGARRGGRRWRLRWRGHQGRSG